MGLETRRNIFHIFAGIGFIILIYLDFIDSVILFGFFIFALLISFLSVRFKIPIIYWFLEKFDRADDLKVFPGKGAVLFVLGVLIASLFSKDIALAGIAVLTFGDSIGALIGINRRIKQPFSDKRFVEGLLAGIFAGFLGALLFVSWLEALIAAIIGMVFESVDVKINDNIIIPFISCLSIYLLRLIF